MKKLSTHSSTTEFTRSTIFRQNSDVLQPRGAISFSRVSIRMAPRLPGRAPRGLLSMGPHSIVCAIGRSGIGPKRHEGDGVTPVGRYTILAWLRRPDRWNPFRPDSQFIKPINGWCDDPHSYLYNRPVELPFRATAENLFRNDGVYDTIGVMDFNWRPRVIGRGSAIFLHLSRPDFAATAGCIALPRAIMRKVQMLWRARLQIDIADGAARRRSPKMAEPTRMWLAPSSIASSKSPLIPMDNSFRPNSVARRFKIAK